METLCNSVSKRKGYGLSLLISLIIFCGQFSQLSASPQEWMYYFEDDNCNWSSVEICATHTDLPIAKSAMALSCKPEVNISLGAGGFAVLTAITLVNAPDYPAFLYDVDIMGPLNDTVFCDQVGQEVMVVVTEIPTGNSCMSTVFVEDKLRPVLTCTPDTLPCNVDISTIDFLSYLDGATDNCDDDLDIYFSYTIQNLPCNPHHFTQQILVIYTATDDSGNSTSCQDVIYLKKPALGQIVFPPDITVDCVNPNLDPSVTGEPTFNGEPLGFTCQLIVTFTDQVVPMCNGSQKIIRLFRVMDWCTSGQITDVQEILIIDDVPPVVTCPANLTIGTSPGVCTTKYTLPLPVVSDVCSDDSMIDIDIFVSGVPGIFAPGQMVNLGLGLTSITIRATDACGNSAMCQYNVTVRDNTPPIPICHSLSVGLGPDGMAFIFANQLDFTIIENCGILSKQVFRMTNTCGVPEDLIPGPDVKFCCADAGDTIMVGFKVTDLSGNMNTCMFQVFVKDLIPPVAECKDITISITNQGTIVITPAMIDDGSTDNCLIVNRTVTPNTFDCDDIGINTVILTVTDQSGNTATCSASVTIEDEVPPVAVCQNLTVTLGAGGTVTITADDVDNGSTDNCAIDTIFLDQYLFTCDDAGTNIIKLTVLDESGNMAMCTAIVTVLTTPPVAICQNITVSLDATGTVTITGSQINNGSFDDCGMVSIVVNPSTFDCLDTGANIVTLTVTDINGNTSTCTAIVTVEDNLPPIALCQDISIMLDSNGMATITPDDINNGSSDNCTFISLALDSTQFDCEEPGPNVVTLTVTDGSGNTSTCTAIVNVMMPDPPTALCQDITVTLNANGIAVITPDQIDNGSFAQCGDVTLEINQDTFDCTDLDGVVVTLTVTDATGATSTCTSTVTVLETPPVAICQNITVSIGPNGLVVITPDDVDNGSTDDCGIEEYSVNPDTFDCMDLGANVVTLTVTDSSGNISTCTAIVTVQDITPPVATCQNITVSLGANGIVIITGAQINNNSTDNCSIISLAVDPDTLTCDDLGLNIVTLTVTDQSGNASTCTANVTVNGLPPVAICQNITVSLGPNGIVVITPDDIDNGSQGLCGDLDLTINEDTFDCQEIGANIVILTVTDSSGSSATCTAVVTVLDNPPVAICQNITISVGGNGIVVITGADINNGSTDDCGIENLSVTPDTFDCTDLGINIVTLTVTDSVGNTSTCTATVTVQDTLPPLAICQNITVSLDGNGIAVITGAQINNNSTDNCTIVGLSVDPDTLTCDNLGNGVVTLTVTDQSGNTSTCTATVTVNGLPPSAICQDITVNLGPNGIVVIGAGDIDNGSQGFCGDLDLSIDEDTFNCLDIGDNTVILTVTDGSGATDTCSATVTVVDNLAPLCSAANLTVFVNGAGNVTITPAQINNGSTDNCTIVTVTVTPDDFTCDDLGPNQVTLTVTDQSGNSSTCTATVTVVDTISPVCNTQDITVSISGGVIVILPTQVNNGSSDNCGPVTLDLDPDTFDCDDLGPNIVVLTVTDVSGNSSTCTATVTIEENGGGLVANCQNVTIFVDSNGNAFVDPEDVNNGSGGGCSVDSLTFNLSQTMFNCTDLGPNIVTLTVTDSEGNTATCTAIITVVDNIPPSIACPPNVTVECSEVTNPNNTAQFGNPTGSDNCGGVTIQENAVFNLNNCNVGTITRTFTATDGSGNTATCVQIVTFQNSNPFTEDDITWPPTPITVNICNSTDPEDLPNGVPMFDPGSLQCANPVFTFSDQIQTIIDNNPNTPCKIITRTFTVTDNCQPGVSFVFVQTINVSDMVPPVIANINNMTKTANANCVAFFTLIASATDCAGVTITNNSPFGATTGANASGNYPVGETIVIFTATDGCGNISTMDVVITVIDPNPTDFLCEKVIVVLPEETEITLCAEMFITFLPGGCTDPDDFIISYSPTNAFDTCRVYDCGDVGVSTFSLWFWNAAGTEKIDSCDNADLDLRDPDDNCMDGLVLIGNVDNEDGLAVIGVDVNVTNAPMLPGTTNQNGEYIIEGLNQGTGYEIAPFNDLKHREGVSTLDLVIIQKHLLGRAKLSSPYKMIAADANKSGHLTALDLLEIRKLILGINTRFPNNTSWRFIDQNYSFPDPFNPFSQPFAESIWIDSVTLFTATADFIGIKIGDVNGSYFLSGVASSKIEPRSASDFELTLQTNAANHESGHRISIQAKDGEQPIDGLQFSLYTGDITDDQLKAMRSDILVSDNWYYDQQSGTLNISWSPIEAQDLAGKILLEWPANDSDFKEFELTANVAPEAYDLSSGIAEVKKVVLSVKETDGGDQFDYNLYQNKPNPFVDGTIISFTLPEADNIRLVVYDIAGRQVFEHKAECPTGRSEVLIKGEDLKTPGIYYYTLYTGNASFTRKMSFTSN